jgi:hypothetical protein
MEIKDVQRGEAKSRLIMKSCFVSKDDLDFFNKRDINFSLFVRIAMKEFIEKESGEGEICANIEKY